VVAFAVGRGWLTETVTDQTEDVIAAFALKKRAMDAGEITERDFKEFTIRYFKYLQSEKNPAYADINDIRQKYREFGFRNEFIDTYLIPENKIKRI
jgi:hypothetical protein